MNGALVYDGPSALTGERILGIVTGIRTGSANVKTGRMAQLWILVADEHPVAAAHSGADVAICGDCAFRPLLAQDGPACYVNKGFGPAAVYRAWIAGKYAPADPAVVGAAVARGAGALRLGAYGDPGALPADVVTTLADAAGSWTGYTHQWRSAPHLRGYCMASADSESDAADALAQGWRYFRVRQASDPIIPGEVACPASAEAGHRVQCVDCLLCRGTARRAKSVVIIDHGPTAARIV